MDFLKSQLDRIQQQLGGLSASQKMLTGSLIAIMVMTLLWWGRFAAQSEMSPVLDKPLTLEEAGNIDRNLRAAGIPATVSGDRVLVPTDRREEALAVLSISEALPQDASSAFDALAKQMSPWLPQSQTDALMKRAKEQMLAGVIRQYPGVSSATVLITPNSGRKIGGGFEASASVNIFTRGKQKLDRKYVDGAAYLVSGAESGLSPGKVRVVVDGVPQPVRERDDLSIGAASDVAEATAAEELRIERRVLDLLQWCPGAIVKCAVDVNTVSSQEQRREYDSKNVIQKEIETENRSIESLQSGGGGAEPGVQANTGLMVADSAPASTESSQTTTEERSKYVVLPGETVTSSVKPAGQSTVLAAAVQLPRSYFASVAKHQSGSDKDLDEPALQAAIAPRLEQIKNDVMVCCNLSDASKVTVSLYDDIVPLMAAASAPVQAPSAVASTLTGHVKEIAVGALAVVSLFMLSLMVRKGAQAPVLVAASEPQLATQLDTTTDLAGVVGDGDPMLDGMELDEDAVKAQQMLNQVQTMVKENPESAANLVKRWLNRS